MHGNPVRHVLKRCFDRVARQDRKSNCSPVLGPSAQPCVGPRPHRNMQRTTALIRATLAGDFSRDASRDSITPDASLSQLLTQLLRPAGHSCCQSHCLKNAVHFCTVNHAYAVRFQVNTAIPHIRAQLSLCCSCSKITTNFSAAVEMQVTGTMPKCSHAEHCPA